MSEVGEGFDLSKSLSISTQFEIPSITEVFLVETWLFWGATYEFSSSELDYVQNDDRV